MERENNICKHVKMRKMKARDFNGVQCIKNEGKKIVSKRIA